MKGAVCFVVLLCMTGYAKAVDVKGECNDSDKICTATILTCQDAKCKAPIGQACTDTSTDECVMGAATCDTDAVCKCPPEHKPKADNSGCEARLPIDAACTTVESQGDCIVDSMCKLVGGANKCQCNTNTSPSADKTMCMLNLNVDETCTVNGTTHCIMGAECVTANSASTCKCMAMSEANAGKTMCQKYIDGACTDDAHCKVGTCKSDKCACAEKETATNNMMECRKAVGETCTVVGDCSDNTECKDDNGTNKCTCVDTYVAEGNYCAMKQTGTCDANTRCVMHSTCKDTKCTCDNEANGDMCKASGAQAVIGSIFVLLAAFVTSRLV